MKHTLLASFVASSLIGSVVGHSWLDCLDWDESAQKCNGYARNWDNAKAEPFGQDVGRDQRPGRGVAAGGLVCGAIEQPNSNPADGYSAAYPMAKLSPGQDIVVRWPAKNHANVGTDRGVQIFISKGPGLGDDFSHITTLQDWVSDCAANGGKCDNTFAGNIYDSNACNVGGVDKTKCIDKFTVPTNLQNGIYTFMWWWEFNAGEYYNSCADVEIVNGGSGGGGGGGGKRSNCDTSAADQCNRDYWGNYWSNAYISSHDAFGNNISTFNDQLDASESNCEGLKAFAECLDAAECCGDSKRTASYLEAKRQADDHGGCEIALPKCGSSSGGAGYFSGNFPVAGAIAMLCLVSVAGGVYVVRTRNAGSPSAQNNFSRPPKAPVQQNKPAGGRVQRPGGRIQRPNV